MELYEFEAQLVILLPKMKVWALALTHNRSAADDLVQETAVNALRACDSFLAGTNLGAWIYRILLNAFIRETRSRRYIADVSVPDQAVISDQIDRMALRDLALAMDLLPRAQRAALVSIAVDERSYEELAQESGCAIGTLKSRVRRARLRLRSHMGDGQRLAA
jgi:RNA polymerase sigma-70 factor (ECF subfamily)